MHTNSTNFLHAIASVGTTMTILLLSIAISFLSSSCFCSAAKDVILEDFGTVYGTVQYSEAEPTSSRTDPMHTWYALTDPVMGGQSIGSATAADGLGVFDGEVRTVPSLNAPGFIAMQTRGKLITDYCTAVLILILVLVHYHRYRINKQHTHTFQKLIQYRYCTNLVVRAGASIGRWILARFNIVQRTQNHRAQQQLLQRLQGILRHGTCHRQQPLRPRIQGPLRPGHQPVYGCFHPLYRIFR